MSAPCRWLNLCGAGREGGLLFRLRRVIEKNTGVRPVTEIEYTICLGQLSDPLEGSISHEIRRLWGAQNSSESRGDM